jgi:hypothetical protein
LAVIPDPTTFGIRNKKKTMLPIALDPTTFGIKNKKDNVPNSLRSGSQGRPSIF